MADKALALWLCVKRILTEMERSETKCLLGGKSTVCLDRHTGRLERERATSSW